MSSVRENVIQSVSPCGPAMYPSPLVWTCSLNVRIQRSSPTAATGAVIVICGGPATSGPNAVTAGRAAASSAPRRLSARRAAVPGECRIRSDRRDPSGRLHTRAGRTRHRPTGARRSRRRRSHPPRSRAAPAHPARSTPASTPPAEGLRRVDSPDELGDGCGAGVRLLDEDHVPGTWDRHQAGARNDVLRLQRIVVSLVEPP